VQALGKTAVIMMAVLLQCFASRSHSGCNVIEYYDNPAECARLAKEYTKSDIRAFIKAGFPVVVKYVCRAI
jgi:hypothetical protein